MADRLPLLIFPQFKSVTPPVGKGFPPTAPQNPNHSRQVERIDPQIQNINSEFQRFRGAIDSTMMAGEPELVLVLELANRVDDLQRAVNAFGLEWLGEWDIDVDADEDFPAQDNKTVRDGRLFVSMFNQQGINELLSLWQQWQQGQTLPNGKTKWRDIFACLKNIRRWGMEETLVETGMREYFEGILDEEEVSFQIECFYHKDRGKRRNTEQDIRAFLEQAGGETISDFIDMNDIAFHAVKARMSAASIKALLNSAEGRPHLFIYSGVMFFRQTGQSIVSNDEGNGEEAEYPQAETGQSPVAAVLDGVPNLQHQALKNRVDFDDPFDLTNKYQPGERLHGTAMASLVIHGDRSSEATSPIHSQIHHVAVMQPNEHARDREKSEHFPEDCFYEDRVEQAVRRILEGDGEVEAQAPTIKIINLSLGDSTKPFIHTLSPWARLLDWLSWKYRVLFCVSAGNYDNPYDFGIPYSQYQSKSDKDKIKLLLEAMQKGLSSRRLLAPAESINALTIGALHQDESGNNYHLGQRVDLLPSNQLLSPVSRLGHGFRRSVKPEIYFPGGRQLYAEPLSPSDTKFKVNSTVSKPGQKVAWDSSEQGKLSKDVFTCGTSNATALATRAGIQIYEILDQLNNESEDQIPAGLTAVLIKTLLVHGSVQNRTAQDAIKHLKNTNNSRTFKAFRARFLGYGAVDIERVLGCTAQRGTVIGCGEITIDKIHEYHFPIPSEFSGQQTFRRMVVTLAWFSPINTRHRYIREAKLEIKPDDVTWKETPLEIDRTDGDYHQVKRGTVQHEILEGTRELAAFLQNEEIVLQIICKKDAASELENIPYGLAVTLEAAAESQIPVYEKIRERLSEQVEITAI